MRRSKQSGPRVDEAEPIDDTWIIEVGVAEAFERLVTPLADALGSGFRVTVGSIPDHGVALITARGQAAMAFLRAKHPTTLFLVNRHGASHHTDDAAAYLYAGADGYIETGVPIEIAAHLRALSRRASR